jgi:hypothetical protein
VCVVVHALYSLKSAGASWHAMLAQALCDIGFVSTIADPSQCLDLTSSSKRGIRLL